MKITLNVTAILLYLQWTGEGIYLERHRFKRGLEDGIMGALHWKGEGWLSQNKREGIRFVKSSKHSSAVWKTVFFFQNLLQYNIQVFSRAGISSFKSGCNLSFPAGSCWLSDPTDYGLVSGFGDNHWMQTIHSFNSYQKLATQNLPFSQ